MNKLLKIVILSVLTTTLTTISYANDIHFGVDVGAVGNVGFSHSEISHKYTYEGVEYDTDKKYGQYDANIDKKHRIENNRKSSAYLDVQLGADIQTSIPELNATPYVDFGAVGEFSKATPSLMLGLGLMGIMKSSNQESDISYLGGIELHKSAFIYIATIPSHYDMFSKNEKTFANYKGLGATLTGGVLYKQYAFKLLYITNSYKLKGFSADDDAEKTWLYSQFPEKIAVQSIGISIGLKF